MTSTHLRRALPHLDATIGELDAAAAEAPEWGRLPLLQVRDELRLLRTKIRTQASVLDGAGGDL